MDDIIIFTISLFCVGLNYWRYKQFSERSALVMMWIMVACCILDILEVII